MRISRKEDYAIILMSELARYYQQRFVALSEVASRYHLSELFLRHIARQLKRRQLIDSKEGVGGGYQLRRSPTSVTVADIIEAFAGSTALTMCGAHQAGIFCSKEPFCKPQHTWAVVNQQVRHVLSSTTLAQFI